MGVLTYQLLSGELPFQGEYDQDLVEAICSCRYEFKSKDRREIVSLASIEPIPQKSEEEEDLGSQLEQQ